MTLTDPTANGGRNECNPACLHCLGTVWPGVLSAALFAVIPIDCRPPGAGSGERGGGGWVGVGGISLTEPTGSAG